MSSASGNLTLSLVGDIYVKRVDTASIFAATMEHLQTADVLFGNCEAPISDRGEPWPGKPLASNNFRMPTHTAEALAAVGFDAVGFASNHSLDFGQEALLQTLELLDAAGIKRSGGGRTLDEARRPAIVEKNGVTMAFLAYTSVYMPGWEATPDRPGVATIRVETAYKPNPRILEQPGAPAITVNLPDPIDRDRLVSDIRAAKAQADLVVVSWHWGVSLGYRALVPYQIEMGHVALDAGADLLIGHHPHVLQGVEIYKGKPLFYSLGNFAFDKKGTAFGLESVIVRCEIADKRISRVSVVPCLIDDECVPRPVEGDRSLQVVRLLEQASADFGTRFRSEGPEVAIG